MKRPPPTDRSIGWLVAVLLFVLPLLVFLPVKDHDFVDYDDNLYVTGNPQVRSGLNVQTAAWALSANVAANWHPLTMLSHLLDVQLFGLDPSGHHLVNLLFHLLNTVLLFLVLVRMSGGVWKSGFVAALFALHPLHVESVAWVAERKDVLSTFFWMLTMGAYASYAERPKASRYVLALLFFALGLTAKPMLVTLPFVLLLLDFWPLKRFPCPDPESRDAFRRGDLPGGATERLSVSRLVIEKAPFFLLSALSAAVTLMYQKTGGAVARLELLPVDLRVMNAALSYIRYLGMMVWPVRLAVFYPHPINALTLGPALGAAFLLAFLTLLVLWKARRHGYLATGWFWYLGTLVPVIGLVQVGDQALADRYTYVPLVGLFIMAAWGLPDLLETRRHRKTVLALSAGFVLLASTILSRAQLSTWRDTASLFEQATRVTLHNHIAHRALAQYYSKQGRLEEASREYRALIEIDPEDVEAHNNLGLISERLGRREDAAREMAASYAIRRFEEGVSLVAEGRFDEAREEFRRAAELWPEYADTRFRRGLSFEGRGLPDKAMTQYQGAIFLRPEYVAAHVRLGNVLLKTRRFDEAVQAFRIALALDPGDAEARKGLDMALEGPRN